MVILTVYKLIYNAFKNVFLVQPGEDPPICPCCGGKLEYRDSRQRIRKLEGGKKEILIIRRLKCTNCHRLHNELPDCLVPYKHYEAAVISGVLEGAITPDDEDSEDYPCEQTMKRWHEWFKANTPNIEGSMRRAGNSHLDMGEELLSSPGSIISKMREKYENWLERILKVIYNSGGSLASAAYCACTCFVLPVTEGLGIVPP